MKKCIALLLLVFPIVDAPLRSAEPAQLEAVASFTPFEGMSCHIVAISSDGKQLAVSSCPDKTSHVAVYDLPTRKELLRRELPDEFISDLRLEAGTLVFETWGKKLACKKHTIEVGSGKGTVVDIPWRADLSGRPPVIFAGKEVTTKSDRFITKLTVAGKNIQLTGAENLMQVSPDRKTLALCLCEFEETGTQSTVQDGKGGDITVADVQLTGWNLVLLGKDAKTIAACYCDRESGYPVYMQYADKGPHVVTSTGGTLTVLRLK